MRLCNETSILVFQTHLDSLLHRMFAREGLLIMLSAAAVGLILGWIALRIDNMASLPLWILALLIVGFTLFFFRDPDRHAPTGSDTVVLAPADGKVLSIEEIDEPLYLNGRARKISIFLSPLDVHVNRIPVDGIVEFVRYVPGDYLVAWHPKASEKNERSEIGVRHPSGSKVLFKQIAGAVARRIVFNLSEGDTVEAGERFGLVKFGSRMDVIVGPDATFSAKVGDRVRAGETVLGHLNSDVRPESTEDESVLEQAGI
jgi:phosphatidylserine decarboxylase